MTYRYAAPDEPLPYIVTDGQALGASTRPALWVRGVDVAAALSRRRYAAPVDVVLEVADGRMPHNAGRSHLVQNELFTGEWADELVFAMLEDEWATRRAGQAGRRDPVAP